MERREKVLPNKNIGYLDKSADKKNQCIIPLYMDTSTGDPSANPVTATVTGSCLTEYNNNYYYYITESRYYEQITTTYIFIYCVDKSEFFFIESFVWQCKLRSTKQDMLQH